MTNMNDDDILNALLDEGDDFELESGGSEPGSEVESDHLSVHSDTNSEADAENISSEFESDDEVPLSEVRASGQSYYIGKDKTKWQKEPFRSNIRSRAENIITHLPGVKIAARSKLSPLECFELFISDAMTDEIVKCTNEKILSRATGDTSQQSQTTKEEIKALYGLLFLSGLARSGRQSTIDLWATDGTGMDIFRDTMSRNRFAFLLNDLRFDSAATRNERLMTDKLAAIRNLFEIFIKNSQDAYIPFENLTLDEELLAFRGRCGFRQYIPSKPAPPANSKRWPLTIFYALLNHAGINGMIIHMFNNGIERNKNNLRSKFIRELGISLIKGHLNTRRQNQKLPRDLRNRIAKYFPEIPENLPEPPAKRSNTQRRCSSCPRNKDRKTKYMCKKCYMYGAH